MLLFWDHGFPYDRPRKRQKVDITGTFHTYTSIFYRSIWLHFWDDTAIYCESCLILEIMAVKNR